MVRLTPLFDPLFTSNAIYLLRFWMYKFAISADIVNMFRQIWVNERHRNYQKSVWREIYPIRSHIVHCNLRNVMCIIPGGKSAGTTRCGSSSGIPECFQNPTEGFLCRWCSYCVETESSWFDWCRAQILNSGNGYPIPHSYKRMKETSLVLSDSWHPS